LRHEGNLKEFSVYVVLRVFYMAVDSVGGSCPKGFYLRERRCPRESCSLTPNIKAISITMRKKGLTDWFSTRDFFAHENIFQPTKMLEKRVPYKF